MEGCLDGCFCATTQVDGKMTCNNSWSDERVFCVTCEGFGKKVQSCFYHICSNSSDRWHFSGQRWSIKVQCHLKSMEKIITEQPGAVQWVPFYSLCNSRLDAPALWGTIARAGSDHLLQGPSKGESGLIATCTLTSSPSFRESSVSSFLGRNQKHHHKGMFEKSNHKNISYNEMSQSQKAELGNHLVILALVIKIV